MWRGLYERGGVGWGGVHWGIGRGSCQEGQHWEDPMLGVGAACWVREKGREPLGGVVG